jgi:hypothetical protein
MKIYRLARLAEENKIQYPEDILSLMNDIEYGYITKNNERKSEIIEEDFYKYYKLQSPKELVKNKIGVCWDQVELERSYFKELDYKFRTIYVILESGNSHTFLVYEEYGKWYWFEHSYRKHRGIHGPFNNIEEICNKVIKFMQSEKEEKEENNQVKVIAEYKKPKYGISCKEFMRHCEKSNIIDL